MIATNDFSGEKKTQNHHIFYNNLPYLEYTLKVLVCCQHIMQFGKKKKKLFSITGSQIWLIPLMEDSQCGYITKLTGINK